MNVSSHFGQALPPSAPSAERLVERLAEKIGSSARAAAVFGETVERDGVTVIPVAKARWGFGGGDGGPGGGRRPGRGGRGADGREAPEPTAAERADGRSVEGRDEQGWGGGGGGGVQIVPVGFIEMTRDGARFRRIVDQSAVIALGAMALVAAGVVWRIAARLER
jgi:uncharacterized spore protein YtfJ